MGLMQTKDDDPRARNTAVAGIIGALLVFVIIVALQALFYNAEEQERVAKVYGQAPEELTRLRAQQLEQINSYRWVDPENGLVKIPIERAMELEAREIGTRQDARASQGP